MSVKPNNRAALEFLLRWSDGPWVLTSIQTDRKSISTATFHKDTLKDAEKWLELYNGKRNIYFSVNPPMRDITKKAEREDIKSVDYLHVDVDPRAGEDLAGERERILSLFSTRLPAGVPKPTFLIFSGGGYQAFWKLEQPIRLDGNLELAEDAKRFNQQLEVVFGGDNCHNIDRIMRLPGTVNIPDAKKIKKGRAPTLAELVSHDPELIYPLERFTPAPLVQLPGAGLSSGGRPDVRISGNIERIADVSELDQWQVPDRVKVIIVQGHHPDEPKQGDNSRSAWLFDAVCNLVRCSVPDDVIFAIVTDPEFGIAESVVDKGANMEKYALRQIEQAKEHAVDPWLRDLNEKYAVIGNIGGKCRVVEEVMDEALGRARLTRQSFDDFRNRYMHIRVDCGVGPTGQPIKAPLGKWWLTHEMRRQFDTIVFCPAREVKGAYNLWKGYAVPAKPGDCSLYLTHILENVCSGDEVLYRYVLGWMARAVQQPGSPGEVALVLRGGRGTGKSVFARQFGMLFGRHFLHISNPSHLVGNFNSHLRDCIALFSDESFFAGDKRHASILKTLITEDTLQIEAKGVDVETAPNYVHLIMASNDFHVIPAGGDERRFLVLEVGHGRQRDTDFFKAMAKQMDDGGREALLHFLLTYDLSEFNVRLVPETEALRDQKHLSLSTEEEWWMNKLQDGLVLRNGEAWQTEVLKDDLVQDYINYTQRFNVLRRGNATTLGKFLKRVCPKLDSIQRLTHIEEPTGDGFVRKLQRRRYHWMLPTLEVARQRWEELYGNEDWNKAPEQMILEEKGATRLGDTPF